MYDMLKDIEVITAMVTPFDENEQVDYKALEKLIQHLLDNGSDAILVAGTTGETPTLTHDEELEILKFTKNIVGNRAKIVMGAGSNSTKTALMMTKEVSEVGVDAILSVVPYYNKPSQSMLINHFSDIAESTDTPIIIYNIPGRTAINMTPDTLAELAHKHKNIVAVKQSNPDLDQITEIAMKTPVGFMIYSGDDTLVLPTLSIGGYGVVSVVSHVAGKEMKEIITSYKKGDNNKALSLHQKLYPLIKAIFMTSNPAPVKAALSKMGIIQNFLRRPLMPLNNEEMIKLEVAMNSFK